MKAYADGADLVLQFDLGQSLSSALHVLDTARDLWEPGSKLLVLCQRKDLRFARSRTRAAISRLGTRLLNRLLPPEKRVQDATCGMRCWSRGMIAALPWEKVTARGYFFNAQALYYALTEVEPKIYKLGFTDALGNRSHLGTRQLLEAGWDYVRLWREVSG